MFCFKVTRIICFTILSVFMLFNINCFAQASGPQMLGSVGMPTWEAELSSEPLGQSKVADWKFGKQTAMVISYDDSTEGAALYGVTEMHRKGLVGTWFVNPGRTHFQNRKSIWHEAFTTYGQEIANHTYNHAGGETEELAEQAVDLATDYIKQHVYEMHRDRFGEFPPKILAFNNGGGTAWHVKPASPEWNSFIRNNILFERRYSGGASTGMTFNEMRQVILELFETGGNYETAGGSIHFHGICDDDLDPNCSSDSGDGAVKKSEIFQFYEWLVDPTEFPAQKTWIAGYAQYRKYRVLKAGSTATLLSTNEEISSTGTIRLELSFTMPDPSEIYTEISYGPSWEAMNDKMLFEDEPITLFTKIPSDWTAVRVTQKNVKNANEKSHVYRVHDSEARYEVYVNRGEILLENADESEVDIVYVGDSSGGECTNGETDTEYRNTQYEQETVPEGFTCQLIEQTRTRTCANNTWGAWSSWTPAGFDTCTVVSTPIIPEAPTNLEASPNTNNTISLNWSPSIFATYYRVYRGTRVGGRYSLVGTNTDNDFTDSSANLIAGVSYYYRVTACNTANECSGPSSYAEAILSDSTVGTFYVAPTGDDSNPGTKNQPWRTIQKAASTIAPGARAIIGSGVYNENVVIDRSGTGEDKRITLVSETIHGAKTQRFTITGSYITVEGFEIESEAAQVSGVSINSGAYVDILKNDIHDCPYMGIRVDSGDYIRIIGNNIHDVAQAGIGLLGSNSLIEDNDISDIVEHHEKIGDIVLGDDADGIRLFGDQNIVRNNRIVNFADMTDDAHGTLDVSHADCIQTTYSGGTPVMKNTLIENNYCQSEHISSKGIMINSTSSDPSHNLIIRNNIFEILDVAISAYEDYYHDIYVYNNIFRCKLKTPYQDPWYSAGIMVGSSTNPVLNYLVVNNITINCNNQNVYGVTGSGDMTNNLRWNSYGIPGYVPPGGTNPKFITFSENFNESDYHLLSISPAVDAGLDVTDLQVDYDGTIRPQGGGYDIGPYELVQSMRN